AAVSTFTTRCTSTSPTTTAPSPGYASTGATCTRRTSARAVARPMSRIRTGTWSSSGRGTWLSTCQLAEDLLRIGAEGRGCGLVGEPLAVERDRRRDELLPGELLEQPERLCLFALGDVAHVVHRTGGHACGVEALEPSGSRLGRQAALQ